VVRRHITQEPLVVVAIRATVLVALRPGLLNR
jgi:hypothetical protein